MTELDRIRDQFHRVFSGPAWHGASVLEVLEGISFQEALGRPVPSAHSIGELVRHLIAWRTLVVHRLKGDDGHKVTDSLDWPGAAGTEAEWQEDLEQLRSTQRELMLLLGRFNPELLDRQVPGSDVGWYALFHGLLQHDLYHLGQIGLLRKALRA